MREYVVGMEIVEIVKIATPNGIVPGSVGTMRLGALAGGSETVA